MKSEIRKPSKHELEQIQEIARRTIEANYRSFLGNEAVDWFIESGGSDQYLSDNIDDCRLLLCGEQIVGFCVCKANIIDLLMVDDKYHRQGYGTKLQVYCENCLFEKFDEITVESFEGNDKANCFYRKNGWIEKERKFDQVSGSNKIVFGKSRNTNMMC